MIYWEHNDLILIFKSYNNFSKPKINIIAIVNITIQSAKYVILSFITLKMCFFNSLKRNLVALLNIIKIRASIPITIIDSSLNCNNPNLPQIIPVKSRIKMSDVFRVYARTEASVPKRRIIAIYAIWCRYCILLL